MWASHWDKAGPELAGLCAISQTLTLVISSSVIARPGNVVAPVGLPNIGPARNDGSANRLFVDKRQEGPIQDGAGASGMLRRFAMAASAGYRVHRLPFHCIAGMSCLVGRRSLSCERIALFPSRADALDNRIDLPVRQRTSVLRAEPRHQRVLLAIRDYVPQR